MQKRASGVLLHITSLPCEYGVGDFGPEAYRFADFLAGAKQRYWQVLPLTPPAGYSPYSCISAFAGNSLLISPELLKKEDLLSKKDFQDKPAFPKETVDYNAVVPYKKNLLNTAYERFKQMPINPSYEKFCSDNRKWLEDFSFFASLREHFQGRLWCDWPQAVRDREKSALESLRNQLRDAIDKKKFLQYQFFKQWSALKRYCNEHKIQIIGDVPIYLAYNSADVWSHPQIFKLTSGKKPEFVSGVPPDHFSKTGQLWGNPVYNWQVLKKEDYSWWFERIKHNLAMFDMVRIDHFTGFVSYWQVPAHHKTASKGKWIKGPGEDFFEKLKRIVPLSNLIVEDLGPLGRAVSELAEKFQLAPTRVLQFAFSGSPVANSHRPYNNGKNSAVYTSTHDSNTVKGWFEKEATDEQKQMVFDYLGRKVPISQIHWELIRLAMSSVCNVAIISVQDILGLGDESRMNRPGTIEGNWQWRLQSGRITEQVVGKLAKMTTTFGR
jgi:4-alpha-glucanotransferase